MIAPDAAWGIVLEHLRPLKPVTVSLANAPGYCLAEAVRADRDLPPADRSSRDGYAVRHADLEQLPRPLRIIGEVAAGDAGRPQVKPGTCVRILTGANVPPGADTIVMVEQTDERDGLVTVRSPEPRGAYILRRGEDAAKRAVLLPAGVRLDGAQIGMCASVGKTSLKVHRRPTVTVLCTGSELRPVGARVRPHEIRNSNGPALCAALARWNFPGVRFASAPDRPAALLKALRASVKRHDVVLLTGGVSVGKYDFVREAVEAAGATVRFHRLAMRPGKPTLYATMPSNRHLFGLPGNPLSTLTAFHEFVLPALQRLAGHPAEACRPAWWLPLSDATESIPGLVRCQLARLVSGQNGLEVVPVLSASSADLASAGHADGVIVLPPDRVNFPVGEWVVFRPWRPLP